MTVALVSGALAQTNAFDVGINYGGAGEPGWTNGANAGYGFGAWTIFSRDGTGSTAAFIGDPQAAGITDMSANSFALGASPEGSGALVIAQRSLSSALVVGETFSLQWGINANSGTGLKGFDLFTGGAPDVGVQVAAVNNGSNSEITFDGRNTRLAYGTNAMTWSFTYSNATTLSVLASGRDGIGSFSTNIAVTGGLSAFRFYADGMPAGDASQSYFNDLQVVPEPSTYVLLALSAAGLGAHLIRRRRR